MTRAAVGLVLGERVKPVPVVAGADSDGNADNAITASVGSNASNAGRDYVVRDAPAERDGRWWLGGLGPSAGSGMLFARLWASSPRGGWAGTGGHKGRPYRRRVGCRECGSTRAGGYTSPAHHERGRKTGGSGTRREVAWPWPLPACGLAGCAGSASVYGDGWKECVHGGQFDLISVSAGCDDPAGVFAGWERVAAFFGDRLRG